MNRQLRSHVLVAVLLGLGAALRITNVGTVTLRTADEQVYTRQANVWLDQGVAGIRFLVAEYTRDPRVQYFPMPTRVGMIRTLATVMKWTRRRDVGVGAIISCAASVASLVIVAVIALRFLPPAVVIPSTFFYALFPPELAIARRTWADALVEFVALVLVLITCEIIRNSNRKLWYVLFALAGSAGLTIKESVLVPYAVCAAWVLWVLLAQRKQFGKALFVTACATVGAVATVWWLSMMTGGLTNLAQIVTGIAKVNAHNPYALEHASGAGYLLLQGLWIVSSALVVTFSIGAFAVSARRNEDFAQYPAAMWLVVYTVANISIAMIVPHWLNLRYVSVAFGTYCLLGGVGVWFMISLVIKQLDGIRRRIFYVLVCALLVLSGVNDYRYFQRAFVRDGVGDLSIGFLRSQRAQEAGK